MKIDCSKSQILEYSKSFINFSLSLGFGIAGVNQVRRISLNIESCTSLGQCQGPILELIQDAAKIAACGYVALKLLRNPFQVDLPKQVKPLDTPPQRMPEIVAFHPGEALASILPQPSSAPQEPQTNPDHL